MKKRIIYSLIFLVAVCASFICGRFIEKGTSGYVYEVRNSEEHDFGHGKIVHEYVTEAVGNTFMDPGTSVIWFKPYGNTGIRLYTAPRIFQEGYFYCRDIKTEDNYIEWKDGVYHYKLSIDHYAKPWEKKNTISCTGRAKTRAPVSSNVISFKKLL